MNNLLKQIADWREQSLQLRKIEREIVAELADGTQEIFDKDKINVDCCVVTKNETMVKITHGEGWASQFIRPDVEVTVTAVLSEIRRRVASAGGKKSKGGGRPIQVDTPEAQANRERVRKHRENLKNQ